MMRVMLTALLLLLALNVVDLLSTTMGIALGHFREANPAADAVLSAYGFWGLAAMKAGGMAIALPIFWCLREWKLARVTAWAFVGIYVALILWHAWLWYNLV
jgi:hypothetical protein